MSCEEIRRHLDDYVDGELASDAREEVERHLRQCLSCRRELNELRALVRSASELPAELDPGRELWPEISARIAPDRSVPASPLRRGRSSGRSRWLYRAAAAAALLALAVPLSLWWAGRQATEGPAVAPRAAAPRFPRYAAGAELARSEDGVLLARRDLLTVVERGRDLLDPETMAVVEANMALLDEAIGELRGALEEEPVNRRLRLLLAARYQQEVRLLQRVSRV